VIGNKTPFLRKKTGVFHGLLNWIDDKEHDLSPIYSAFALKITTELKIIRQGKFA
jgi:hypothetical protein